uniref:Uncharacterized protein n=1 Tax=Romanomermis culicivorax TaxID=13658 RepID=A0A915K5X3_ROMCU
MTSLLDKPRFISFLPYFSMQETFLAEIRELPSTDFTFPPTRKDGFTGGRTRSQSSSRSLTSTYMEGKSDKS